MIFRFVANDSSEMLTITCGKEDVVYGCNDTFVVLSGNITTFTIPEQKTIPEQTNFIYIMATSFSGGRSRSIRREPSTMGKQLVNFYHLWLRVECTLFCNLHSGARTHTVQVRGLYEF
jgi:hypothetical protein